MTKKLLLVLGVLSLLPSLANATGKSIFCSADGKCVYNDGRTRTSFRSGGNRTTAFSSRSSSSRGLGGAGIGQRFGTAVHGASGGTSQSLGVLQTAEGATALSPGMFTRQEQFNQPTQWIQPGGFSGIAMEDSSARATTGIGVFQGEADLTPGSKPGQSGGYGSFYSGK